MMEFNPFSYKPTAQDIALACSHVPDFSPLAELAKVAAMVTPISSVGPVGGVYLTDWQMQIFHAQIMVLLGIDL